MWSMPAAKFFRFAYRIGAYGGMVAQRIEAQNYRPASPELAAGEAPAAAARSPRAPNGREGQMPVSRKYRNARVVPLASMALSSPGLIERTTVPGPISEQT